MEYLKVFNTSGSGEIKYAISVAKYFIAKLDV